jgi:lipoprotein-anchoring transpeptidase ErfK/SrfK
MRRGAALAAVACLAGVLLAAIALTIFDSDRPPASTPAARLERHAPAPALGAPAQSTPPPRPDPGAAGQPSGASHPVAPALPSGPVGARILRRTQLRRSPGGAVVRAIGTTTSYGSERVLSVVARRGDWLAVLTDHMPNSRAAWIPAGSAELVHEPYRLDVDLSARRIVVRHDGRVVRRIRVAVGKPSTSTPIGRFAVTDTLRVSASSPEYGCCAVALTGRQPNLPPGWTVSDRLAIHGTPNEGAIGEAVSNGCLHAAESDMRWLLRRVTLGARVQIRA